MKHSDAKALVFAMFGSKKISTTGAAKMISPLVQQAYNEAFGEYPPKDINEQMIWKEYWATRLREIADALENCCSRCLGASKESDGSDCTKCEGQGHVVTSLPTQTDFMEYASVNVKCCVCGTESGFRHVNAWDCGEHTLVDRMKALLLEFGVKDKQDYVKACLTLDYSCELLFVQVSKKIWKTV